MLNIIYDTKWEEELSAEIPDGVTEDEIYSFYSEGFFITNTLYWECDTCSKLYGDIVTCCGHETPVAGLCIESQPDITLEQIIEDGYSKEIALDAIRQFAI